MSIKGDRNRLKGSELKKFGDFYIGIDWAKKGSKSTTAKTYFENGKVVNIEYDELIKETKNVIKVRKVSK